MCLYMSVLGRWGAEVKQPERQRCVFEQCVSVRVCECLLGSVYISVGLEVLGRSFLVRVRRAVVVEGKTPAQSGLNITG